MVGRIHFLDGRIMPEQLIGNGSRAGHLAVAAHLKSKGVAVQRVPGGRHDLFKCILAGKQLGDLYLALVVGHSR